jgi:hypothetical protein
LCPPPFNRDEQQHLALAMASDFSVACQYSQGEQTIVFLSHIKLHARILDFYDPDVVIETRGLTARKMSSREISI